MIAHPTCADHRPVERICVACHDGDAAVHAGNCLDTSQIHRSPMRRSAALDVSPGYDSCGRAAGLRLAVRSVAVGAWGRFVYKYNRRSKSRVIIMSPASASAVVFRIDELRRCIVRCINDAPSLFRCVFLQLRLGHTSYFAQISSRIYGHSGVDDPGASARV